MPDKYQQIREDHEIELAKKITALNEKQKRTEKRIVKYGFFAIGLLIAWFITQMIAIAGL